MLPYMLIALGIVFYGPLVFGLVREFVIELNFDPGSAFMAPVKIIGTLLLGAGAFALFLSATGH